MGLLFEELTRSAIGCFYSVYNKLGYGFLENVYVGALEVELKNARHIVAREVPVAVTYENIIVGSYRTDLLIDRQLVIEVKAEPSIKGVHERQLRNYLRCSDIEIGLVLCFGIKPEFRRFVHSKKFKSPRAVDQQPLSLPQ